MSKFAKQPVQTVNSEGYAAFRMDRRTDLVTKVLTCLFGEEKFYGNRSKELILLAEKEDMQFVSRLAVYARKEMHLRSVAHVLTAVVARHGREHIRATVRGVVERADDVTEILAAYLGMYGKPVPNGLKKALAEAIGRFDEYSLAKYKGEKNFLTMRDAVRIVHPKPDSEERSDLYRRIIAGELATPQTWETQISARGNTAEVWDELIEGGKLGYMAMLRNLRNIVKSGCSQLERVCKIIADPEQVRKSKQLPFRFYAAHRMLPEKAPLEVLYALADAMEASVANVERIPGRSLIAVDVSGSMSWQSISANSSMRPCDVALVLAAMGHRICDEAVVVSFDTSIRKHDIEPGTGIFRIVDSIPVNGGGTRLELPLRWALDEAKKCGGAGKREEPKAFDRMILLSDNQINSGYEYICQALAGEYRRKVNPDFWVHAIDMMGYGTQQFAGEKTNIITGWNENVLSFIMQAERGAGSIVEAIEAYEI